MPNILAVKERFWARMETQSVLNSSRLHKSTSIFSQRQSSASVELVKHGSHQANRSGDVRSRDTIQPMVRLQFQVNNAFCSHTNPNSLKKRKRTTIHDSLQYTICINGGIVKYTYDPTSALRELAGNWNMWKWIWLILYYLSNNSKWLYMVLEYEWSCRMPSRQALMTSRQVWVLSRLTAARPGNKSLENCGCQ